MKTLSYAQNLEDILLNRVFADRPEGFYIDVGACHPILDSVTKLFYERGWRGINIEPVPKVFQILAEDRGRDINLPVGLSNREGVLPFFEVAESLGSSTFSAEQAEELRREGFQIVEHSIPVTTLARICEEHAGPSIDFLKIDVESHEREVLEGADWKRFRPRVVLIEATRPNTNIPSHDEWEPLLLDVDYHFAFFDGLNRYYVRGEDRDLLPKLSVPVNYFDDYDRFPHVQRVQELERESQELRLMIETLQRTETELRFNLADAQAQLAELPRLRLELDGVRRELSAERGELHSTRSALERAGGEIAAMQGRIADLEAELRVARERLALFEGWGPMTVSLVRRLRSIAVRVPLAKPMLRQAFGVARGLRTVAVGPHA